MEGPKSTSFVSLPPGCRFYPSEEQLLCCYLPYRNRNLSSVSPNGGGGGVGSVIDVIRELNLYNYNPFDLPEATCFRFGYHGRRRHWYCYTERVVDGKGGRLKRRAGFGYWKRKGKVRDVMGDGGKVVLGRRSCYVFYMDKWLDERNKSVVRTDWIMYEYVPIDDLKAAFVLCRVFKSHARINLSDQACSCAEQSRATLPVIGVQCHESCTSDFGEARAYGPEHVGDGFQFPSSLPLNNMAGSSGLAQQFRSVMEGDYIELDDLV
ncbi:hypothetical protein Dimus_027999 [Dionaea muscipula]